MSHQGNTTISKYLNVNSDLFQTEEKRDENREYTVAGRIKFFRLMGKASFSFVFSVIFFSTSSFTVSAISLTFSSTVFSRC